MGSPSPFKIPFPAKCSIFIFIIIYLNRNAWYGPVFNKSSKVPLVWSSKNNIPPNSEFIWVGEFYPFYRWDCDMYLSWPDQKESHHLKNFDVENHPGPSFKWSMEVYNDEKVRDMDCVIWDEPFDRDTWYDNAMCLPKDSKFEMKFLSDLADIDDGFWMKIVLELIDRVRRRVKVGGIIIFVSGGRCQRPKSSVL